MPHRPASNGRTLLSGAQSDCDKGFVANPDGAASAKQRLETRRQIERVIGWSCEVPVRHESDGLPPSHRCALLLVRMGETVKSEGMSQIWESEAVCIARRYQLWRSGPRSTNCRSPVLVEPHVEGAPNLPTLRHVEHFRSLRGIGGSLTRGVSQTNRCASWLTVNTTSRSLRDPRDSSFCAVSQSTSSSAHDIPWRSTRSVRSLVNRAGSGRSATAFCQTRSSPATSGFYLRASDSRAPSRRAMPVRSNT